MVFTYLTHLSVFAHEDHRIRTGAKRPIDLREPERIELVWSIGRFAPVLIRWLHDTEHAHKHPAPPEQRSVSQVCEYRKTIEMVRKVNNGEPQPKGWGE